MSPPLADPESDSDSGAPAKRRKTMSNKQMIANANNACRSRGPGPAASKRTRYNACKHNLRAESDLLPGENAAELKRRLAVWPVLMEADGEQERFVAQQTVHLGWRLERANRSEAADIERRRLDFARAEEDRQAEQARTLGLELDSDVDPQGVVRKLLRSPAGCTLLLNEWTNLAIRINEYDVLVWSQRERLFHLIGKRLRDLFSADPEIFDLLVLMMGAMFGDCGEAKAQEIGHVLAGLRPDWMGDDEFAARMTFLAEQVPDAATAGEMVRAYFNDMIDELTERLALAEAEARLRENVDHAAEEVDDSAAGARRLNYKLGHWRSFNAACRHMTALQQARRGGGGGGSKAAVPKPDRQPARADANAPAPSPVVETPTESVATNDLLLTARADATVPVTIADTLAVTDGPSGLITNDPISSQACPAVVAATHDPVDAVADAPGFSGTSDPLVTDEPLLTAVSVTEPDTLGLADSGCSCNPNDPISSQAATAVVASTDNPIDAGTAAPVFSECEVIGCDVGPVDWCARARGTPPSDEEVSWRAYLRPASPESRAGGQRAGEPPTDRRFPVEQPAARPVKDDRLLAVIKENAERIPRCRDWDP